jgi:hypothetical protein
LLELLFRHFLDDHAFSYEVRLYRKGRHADDRGAEPSRDGARDTHLPFSLLRRVDVTHDNVDCH